MERTCVCTGVQTHCWSATTVVGRQMAVDLIESAKRTMTVAEYRSRTIHHKCRIRIIRLIRFYDPIGIVYFAYEPSRPVTYKNNSPETVPSLKTAINKRSCVVATAVLGTIIPTSTAGGGGVPYRSSRFATIRRGDRETRDGPPLDKRVFPHKQPFAPLSPHVFPVVLIRTSKPSNKIAFGLFFFNASLTVYRFIFSVYRLGGRRDIRLQPGERSQLQRRVRVLHENGTLPELGRNTVDPGRHAG